MKQNPQMAEITEDLNLIGPLLHNWLHSLPQKQQDILKKEFYNASHLYKTEELYEKIKDKNFLKSEPLQATLGLKEETMQQMYTIAYNLHQARDEQKARALFRFLSFLNPHNVDYWMGLGTCLFIEGRIVEAQSVFEIARVINPENPEPYFFIARCNHMLGNLDNALRVCRDAILFSEAAVNAPCYHASLELEKQLQKQIQMKVK